MLNKAARPRRGACGARIWRGVQPGPQGLKAFAANGAAICVDPARKCIWLHVRGSGGRHADARWSSRRCTRHCWRSACMSPSTVLPTSGLWTETTRRRWRSAGRRVADLPVHRMLDRVRELTGPAELPLIRVLEVACRHVRAIHMTSADFRLEHPRPTAISTAITAAATSATIRIRTRELFAMVSLQCSSPVAFSQHRGRWPPSRGPMVGSTAAPAARMVPTGGRSRRTVVVSVTSGWRFRS